MVSRTDAPRALRVEQPIATTPEEAWELIADITRMGDWSPETTSARWTRGASGPTVGARFKGTNQLGSKTWNSDCVVTACVPGKRFAFDVKVGPFKVASWAYEFTPLDSGCVVTELWEDHRSTVATWLSPVITGTKDRATRNQETMTVTLQRLATALEDVWLHYSRVPSGYGMLDGTVP
jgi:Polyketide cyclase / dehydrase and lipid transport